MTNEEQQVIFTSLTTLMSSIVANFLVTREMPAEYLEILGQNISSALQEMDTKEEDDSGC